MSGKFDEEQQDEIEFLEEIIEQEEEISNMAMKNYT